ncbi:hypothetical protein AVEN_260060-1 [Araneus ventricosus]|uniref:Uncharacterized protein n=1 Tax=Araneus ventricosus TaxID=182803 RepID=A0A4Y2G222_ARAVE|nr:hypothetical protein AVEN_260060-1 [Araneus ventricosus]
MYGFLGKDNGIKTQVRKRPYCWSESNTEPAGESVASSPVSEEPSVPGTTDELVSCETPVNCSEGESVLFDLNDPGTWPENLTDTQKCFIVSKLVNKLVNELDLTFTCFWLKTLKKKTDIVSKMLQIEDIAIDVACNLLKGLTAQIKDCRGTIVNEVLEEAKESCLALNVDPS